MILASASPRRQELLRMLVKEFRVCPADIDETPAKYLTPSEYALSMATQKALAVTRDYSAPVLGADTVVCLGGKILGKPVDIDDNFAMLKSLSGKWHSVLTAVALCHSGEILGWDVVTTRVRFTSMSDQDILSYVEGRDGLDKAGGYGIQGEAGRYIAGIDGCYYNVVGLPVAAVAALISAHI